LPGLVELEKEYGSKGVRFIGINLDANSDTRFIKDYIAQLGASNFVWVTDNRLTTARAYIVQSAGVTVIIDRKGGVSYRDDAPTTKGKLKAEIERALSPSRS